jgi:anti-sigma factor RsiW
MERLDLEAWCQRHPEHRWAAKRLEAIVDECFDHFRSTGELGHDWLATVRNWIRRAPRFNPTMMLQPQARQEWKAEPLGEPANLEAFREARRKVGV